MECCSTCRHTPRCPTRPLSLLLFLLPSSAALGAPSPCWPAPTGAPRSQTRCCARARCRRWCPCCPSVLPWPPPPQMPGGRAQTAPQPPTPAARRCLQGRAGQGRVAVREGRRRGQALFDTLPAAQWSLLAACWTGLLQLFPIPRGPSESGAPAGATRRRAIKLISCLRSRAGDGVWVSCALVAVGNDQPQLQPNSTHHKIKATCGPALQPTAHQESRNFQTRRSRLTSPTSARRASVKLSTRPSSSLRRARGAAGRWAGWCA